MELKLVNGSIHFSVTVTLLLLRKLGSTDGLQLLPGLPVTLLV